MVNMVTLNANTFTQKQWSSTTLKQMINKALHTIKVLCEELSLDHVAEQVYFKYTKVRSFNI